MRFDAIYNVDRSCHMNNCGKSGVILAYDEFSPETASWFCGAHWEEQEEMLTIVPHKRWWLNALKWNGEYWYIDERSVWKRARQWVIWVGGWEKANGKGWKFLIDYGNKKRLMSPTPISLFNHRITFYGWGWRIRLWRRCIFTWSKSGAYISNDGTPPRFDKENTKGFYIIKKRSGQRSKICNP